MIMVLLIPLTLGLTALPSAPLSQHQSAANAIAAKNAADSIKYFIKIVPHDSATDEHMPSASGDEFVPVDQQPIPVKQVDGRYPAGDPLARTTATVWVRGLIGKDGSVGTVKVMRSDAPRLDAAAIAAAKQWRFTPAFIADKPIAVWAAFKIRFHPTY